MGIAAPRKDLFGREFQKGLLRLALEQDEIALRLTQYLANDVDTRDSMVFADSALTFIFHVICNSIKNYGSRPGPAQVIETIKSEGAKDGARLMDCYKSILQTQIHDSQFHKERLVQFFQRVKMAKMAEAMERDWSDEESDKPQRTLGFYADEVKKVTMDNVVVFRPKDIHSFIKDYQQHSNKPVPTGFKLIDDLLGGGLPRRELVGVLGIANNGKSVVTESIAANAIREGYKVLVIPIEGTVVQDPFRYMANLSDIEMSKFYSDSFTDEDRKQLDQTAEKIQENLVVHPLLQFGVEVEDVAALAREYYKSFKFDVLVVDYGRLLGTRQRFANQREKLEIVHNGLSQLAKEFNCVCMTPVQANREAFAKRTADNASKTNKNLSTVQLEDIGEAISISQMTGIMLGVNMTKDERDVLSQIRVQILKQRQEGTMDVFAIKIDRKKARFWGSEGHLVTGAVESSNMISKQEEANKVSQGTVSEEDRKKLQLRDALDLARQVHAIAHQINDSKKKSDASSTPETKQKYAEVILKHEEKGRRVRLDAIASIANYYEGKDAASMLPALKDSYKEMELQSSSFTPEQREEARLLMNLTEWFVKSKENKAA